MIQINRIKGRRKNCSHTYVHWAFCHKLLFDCLNNHSIHVDCRKGEFHIINDKPIIHYTNINLLCLLYLNEVVHRFSISIDKTENVFFLYNLNIYIILFSFFIFPSENVEKKLFCTCKIDCLSAKVYIYNYI